MAAAACAALIGLAASATAAPTNEECEARINDTSAKLLECIREAPLFAELRAFQAIADANPDKEGHGNRDTGTSGYLASVDYVAAKLRAAGYAVTIQKYNYPTFEMLSDPGVTFDGRRLRLDADFRVARLSGSGALTARITPIGWLATAPGDSSPAGCSPRDFAGFSPGDIALVQRGGCAADAKVANAERAGAAAVIVVNTPPLADGDIVRGEPMRSLAADLRLETPASAPVIGYVPFALGAELFRRAQTGRSMARVDVQTRTRHDGVDYNVIADAKFGDPNRVVVLEGHLDAIYGAGILDNASGSATILQIALKLANTPTANHLRYIWFGGEEIGLYGSKYYTTALPPAELARIAFDIDADVTATPNYAILVADPRQSGDIDRFPKNVGPQSQIGNGLFFNYFKRVGLAARAAGAGNEGTDSHSFAKVGVPDTGIFTQQDCCKPAGRVALWGGHLGNYEGDIPSFDGGCVDKPRRWCDNIDNINPALHETVSKATAFVTFRLANDPKLPTRR